MKPIKTNAMRMLDRAKIKYESLFYEVDENNLAGTHIADCVGLPYSQVFKTIVAKGDKTGPCVFCIPVNEEIDLKLAAVVSGNKKIEMVAVKDLLALTGYIRGGCSPVGMKKQFPTFFDESALSHEKITVSAGIKGCQLLIDREKLTTFVNAKIQKIIR